jgi:hypothetical protein
VGPVPEPVAVAEARQGTYMGSWQTASGNATSGQAKKKVFLYEYFVRIILTNTTSTRKYQTHKDVMEKWDG